MGAIGTLFSRDRPDRTDSHLPLCRLRSGPYLVGSEPRQQRLMSTAKVLKLGEYRDRRLQRLEKSRLTLRRDRRRATLYDHLVEFGSLADADRVAVVWVDEYGSDLVHPHVIVDHLARPLRRDFSNEPLTRAWEAGVPGSYDQAGDGPGGSSTFAVALGSDGSRGWFIVADSMRARGPLRTVARERCMYLAGECSAIVLHRDLDGPGDRRGGFAGWSILKDLEGFEDIAARTNVVERRFAVGRLAQILLDQDLVMADSERTEAAARVRIDLDAQPVPTSERRLLDAAIDAYEAGDVEALAGAVLQMGEVAETSNHINGALFCYSCAFDLSARADSLAVSIDAARFTGRIFRRKGFWEDADDWYSTALALSTVDELPGKESLVLNGIATVQRDRGNLPAARATLDRALEAAHASGEDEVTAAAYHAVMGVEQLAGNLPEALDSGWTAIKLYQSDVGRTNCLTGLAALLQQMGDWQTAEDAYTVVAHTSDVYYYRIYAYDALSHLAALRGDEATFEIRARAADALDWERGPHNAKAEIMCYRGISYRLLGRTEQARAWLTRAVAFAEEHQFNQTVFRAEAELAKLDEPVVVDAPAAAAPSEMRAGLRTMREAVTTV